MSIEQAIKRKQREAEGIDDRLLTPQTNTQIDELKKAIREDVIKEGAKDENVLSNHDKLRASVWQSLEQIERMHYQNLLLTTEDRRNLTDEIIQE